ncbi:hypothetical protein QYM36_003106 [Artemia franciscana]|uniref:Uncharacterized protein n=1 Tax=Artemia franciscana TaxID=6661 RepID=A0AA88IJF3_ARTSF|nr:hypothetical protein QYM36_003106 [Artemia franciscana]
MLIVHFERCLKRRVISTQGSIRLPSRQVEEAASRGDRRLLKDVEVQKEQWASSVEAQLNRTAPVVLPGIPPQSIFVLSISDDDPTADKILLAVKNMKIGEAPGTDRISAEIIKSSPRQTSVIWRSSVSFL